MWWVTSGEGASGAGSIGLAFGMVTALAFYVALTQNGSKRLPWPQETLNRAAYAGWMIWPLAGWLIGRWTVL